jgi:hypothetical protein
VPYNRGLANKLVSDYTERDLRQVIIDAAREVGWLVSFAWTSIHSPKGLPDLTLVNPPRLIYAELKSEKGKPTEAQQVWLDTLAQVPGVEVYLWKPSMLDDIYHTLLEKP